MSQFRKPDGAKLWRANPQCNETKGLAYEFHFTPAAIRRTRIKGYHASLPHRLIRARLAVRLVDWHAGASAFAFRLFIPETCPGGPVTVYAAFFIFFGKMQAGRWQAPQDALHAAPSPSPRPAWQPIGPPSAGTNAAPAFHPIAFANPDSMSGQHHQIPGPTPHALPARPPVASAEPPPAGSSHDPEGEKDQPHDRQRPCCLVITITPSGPLISFCAGAEAQCVRSDPHCGQQPASFKDADSVSRAYSSSSVGINAALNSCPSNSKSRNVVPRNRWPSSAGIIRSKASRNVLVILSNAS